MPKTYKNIINLGGAIGSVVGTAIVPGLGTLAGSLFGTVCGGIATSIFGMNAFNKISDAFNYNIEKVNCIVCGKLLKRRKYKKDKSDICESCAKTLEKDEKIKGNEKQKTL